MPEDKKKNASKQPKAAPEQASPWENKTGGGGKSAASTLVQPVSWQAPEYLHNQKSAGWFFLVMLASVVVAGLVYLISRDWISTGVVLTIGIAFTVFAARKPRVLEYSVDGTGIHIGQKTYPYDHYRSFSILEDESVPTILLTPLRRFDLPLQIHFDEVDADKILDIIGSHLPGEQGTAPPVDRLMTKIRF